MAEDASTRRDGGPDYVNEGSTVPVPPPPTPPAAAPGMIPGAHYGAAPVGYAPVPPTARPATTEKNWAGWTSLVLGILGGGLLALIFGIIGVRAASQGRATNGKVALTGLILSVAVPVLLFGGVIVADALSGRTSAQVENLQVGQCVLEPRGWDDAGGELNSSTVKVVDCEAEHWGQVAYTTEHTASTYPGDGPMIDWADKRCFSNEVLELIRPEYLTTASIGYIYPTEDSWFYGGDRSLTCFVTDLMGEKEGSWLVGY